MNEQLQAWLVATLERLTTVTGQVYDFAAGELPLFVKEFLLFHIVWSWFMTSVGLIGLLTIIFTVGKLKRMAIANNWDAVDLITGLYICYVGILGGISLLIFMVNLYWALMVTFAPRVYLVHEFIKFFK